MIFPTNKIYFLKLFGILFFAFFANCPIFSQNRDLIVTNEYNNLAWEAFVQKVEHELQVKIYYKAEEFPAFTVQISQNTLLSSLLANHLNKFGYLITIDKNNNVFISKEPINTTVISGFFENFIENQNNLKLGNEQQMNAEFIQTNNEFIAREITVGSKKQGLNKSKAVVSGYIKDANTKKPISGATIALSDLSFGAVTDDEGHFSFQLDKGKYNMTVSYVGSKEEKIEVSVLSDGSFELFLEDEAILLNEAVISANKYDKVKGTEMGIEKITTKSVKEIPLVMGEKDIIKVALLLPGIQTVGEGSSGFNVRGSPTDQNLFYINNLPIYNTSHLAGFFSSFNSDVIDEFTLYKSNIPVKFGGRLSSIFEITAKQGNKERYTASGGISPITGRILFEGPIKKNTSSFIIGLRSTYSDWLLKLAKNPDIKESSANFGDAIANFTFNLGNKDQINLFSYYSYDQMDLARRTNYNYKNIGSSLVWKHSFNNVNSHDLSFVHSIYNFSEESKDIAVASYTHSNKLEHTEIKSSFNFNNIKDHKINFGLNSILYQVHRGKYEPLSLESLIDSKDLGKEKGIESALFFSDEWTLSPKLSVSAGLRYNLFAYIGAQDVNVYLDNLPKISANIIDTLHFKNNEIIKSYGGLDYRIAANYMFSNDFSIKLSYNRQHQYIYMLSNSIAISPDYKWKLSDYNTKPIVGDQYAAGLYFNTYWGGHTYDLSIEGYYKNAKNIVEIKDGANLIMNEFSEQSTLQGKMDAYGVELMLKKNTGKLNGWFNYTYSKTSVKVDSEFPENKINFGYSYPSNYDKPHALNLVASYRIKRRLSVSGNVVYSTGRPITYPTAIYYQNGFKTLHYSKRNEYRIPDYFRVDLSVSIEGNLKKNKLAHGSWTFSVYNLTGRNNAYSVYFRYEEGKINGYKLSIFGSPIVSLTYNFKLGNYAN